ncbi:MAG: DUF3786 domain-containing protein [Eubacteriales bacterium]|nr:DUF3786 domain-containing protein [Eubacteriales bacterium]
MAFTIEDLNYEKDNKERMPWEHYLEQYQKLDPHEIAARLEIPYNDETKAFTLTFIETEYQITFPDFAVTHTPDEKRYYPLEDMIWAKILVIRFLINGAEVKGSGKFLTYREMPWGEVYCRQFDGRCIKRLAFSYGFKLNAFKAILEHMGATPLKHGDASYELEVFRNYKMQLILWEGDDEFPPSAQILFSDNFPASFHTEDLAEMGDVVIGSMKQIAKLI